MADNVEVGFIGNLEGVRVSITQLSELLRGLSSPIQGVRSALGEMAEAFAAAFAVEKISEFARSMGEMAEGIEKTSAQLGVSTNEVQQLGYIAKSSGTNVESLASEFSRLSMSIAERSDRTTRALKDMGLSISQVTSKDAMGQMELFADVFSNMQDGWQKNALGMAIFGRNFREIILLLNQGREGIQRLRDESAALGAIVPPEALAQLAALHHEFVMMDAAVQGAATRAFVPFSGVVRGVVAIVEDLAASFGKADENGSIMNALLRGLADTFKGIVTGIGGVVYVLKDLWAVGSFALMSVGQGFITMAKVAADVVKAMADNWNGFWQALLTAGELTIKRLWEDLKSLGSAVAAGIRGDWGGISSAFGDIEKRGVDTRKAINDAWSKSGLDLSKATTDVDTFNSDQEKRNAALLKTLLANDKAFADQAKKIWDDVHEHENGAKKPPPVTPPDRGAADRVRAAMEAIQGEIKAEQDGLKMKISVWDAAVAANRMTQQERMKLVQDATSDEYGAEHDLLEKELAIEGLKLAQRQKILNDIAALERKHYADMVKLDQEAVAAAQKDIEGYLTTLTGAFNSQLRGLLAGTTSWKEAMKAIAGDLIMAMIQGLEKWVVTWIAGQLAATTASTSGAAARAAAETAGSSVSIAETIATAMSKIGAGVASTIAGVTGNLALLLGPAAPAAGAAAGAETMAEAVVPLALDTGAWQIGAGVTPAFLHPGEMVLPGPSADMMRDALGGGGGGDIHLHVSAIDGASVARLFQNNGVQLASVLRDVWQKNRSVRPAF